MLMLGIILTITSYLLPAARIQRNAAPGVTTLSPFDGRIQHSDDKIQHSVYSGRYRDYHTLQHNVRKLQRRHYTFEREYQRNASSDERKGRKYQNSHGIIRYTWTSSAPCRY